MSNYPAATYQADPRAPWNQKTPAESGLTCQDCEIPHWAPKEWCYTPCGWCQAQYEWVRPSDPACDYEFEMKVR